MGAAGKGHVLAGNADQSLRLINVAVQLQLIAAVPVDAFLLPPCQILRSVPDGLLNRLLGVPVRKLPVKILRCGKGGFLFFGFRLRHLRAILPPHGQERNAHRIMQQLRAILSIQGVRKQRGVCLIADYLFHRLLRLFLREQ